MRYEARTIFFVFGNSEKTMWLRTTRVGRLRISQQVALFYLLYLVSATKKCSIAGDKTDTAERPKRHAFHRPIARPLQPSFAASRSARYSLFVGPGRNFATIIEAN
jgi:hypothetical protein